ncbi:hypothetical protein INT43_006406 [Umbelopsis isabellina]|uniref:BCAS3 domain-containing protein n=1 Tax=Mortierella isabellina TaxID=91625 RepID=A0A8H7Q0Q6_MORIS|nr:hypothetical protein INT43_006406 [Umbelopsis isabellina]
MTDRIQTSQQGVRAEPKFLRDPTSLESLSSGISRISTYVTSNLPKKRASLPSFLSPFDPQYSHQYMYGVPQQITAPMSSEVAESAASEMDNSFKSYTTPTFAAFDSLTCKKKDQKGQSRLKCLMVGYHDGFQIWDVNNPDNIHELCSIRDEKQFANVTTIHNLVNPRHDKNHSHGRLDDVFEKHRPLIAIVSNPSVTKENSPNDGQQEHHDHTSATNPMTPPTPAAIPCKQCKVDIYSLRTHEVVKTLENFDVDESVEITEIQSNDRVIVLAAVGQNRSRIHILSAASLEQFAPPLIDVFHEVGKNPPFTLGSRFLAYATSTPVLNTHQGTSPGSSSISGASLGVLSGEKDVKDAAKEVAKEVVNGVKALSEYGYQTLSNYFSNNPSADMANVPPMMPNAAPRRDLPYGLKDPNDRTASGHLPSPSGAISKKGAYGGMVMVRDILKLPSTSTKNLSASVLAHYRPHTHPIMILSFNAAGTLLMSVSRQGHTFHVFSILPSGSNTGSTAHLYSLLRGYTDAQVEDSKFSTDSMWCAVSTARGTTHLYAINPDGGRPEILGHVRGKARNSYAGFAVPRGLQQPKPVSQGPAVRIKQRTPMPTLEHTKVENGAYNSAAYPGVIHPMYSNQYPSYVVPHPMPPASFQVEPKAARAKLITSFLSTTKPTFLFRGNTRQQPADQKPSIVNMNTLASLTSPSLRQIRDKASSLGSMISTLSGANGQTSNNSSPQQKGRSWINPNDNNNDNRVFGFEEEEASLEEDTTKVIGDEVGYQDIYSFHPDGILTLHRCCIASGIARRRENGRVVERIELSVRQEDIAEWRVARSTDWDEIKTPLESSFTLPITASNKNGQEKAGGGKSKKKKQGGAMSKPLESRTSHHAWLSNAEISTYPVTPDDHNLWSLPQFSFQTYEGSDNKKIQAALAKGRIPATHRLIVKRDMPEPISRRVGRVNRTMARNAQKDEDGDFEEALAELEDNLSKAMQTNFSSSPYNVMDSSPVGSKRMSSSAGNTVQQYRPSAERVPSLSFEDAYLINMGGGATGFETSGSMPGTGFTPPISTSYSSPKGDKESALQNSSLIRFDDDELLNASLDLSEKDLNENDAVQVVAENPSRDLYNPILQGDQVFSPDGDNEVAYPSDSIILPAEMPESI